MVKYKHLQHVAFFFVVVLALVKACNKPLDNQLDAIEQELNSNPASAYEQLTGLSSELFYTKSRRARYALLMSMAMDKSYIDIVDDSLVQNAVHYYQHHGDEYHRMLAMYSLGRVQYNAQKHAAAIISFTQAKDIAEAIGDQHYLGLIMRNMANLYNESDDYDTALLYFQSSARAFLTIGERYYAVYSQLGEAEACMSKGLFETADSILCSLETYARDNKLDRLLCTLLKSRALNLVRPNKMCYPEMAVQLFRESEEKGVLLDQTVEFGALALAHQLLNHSDSADYYLALAEEHSKTLLDSTHLFNTKYQVYYNRGKYLEAAEQLFETVSLHNKLIFNKENNLISNSVSEFRGQESIHQAALAKYRFLIIILLSFILLAVSCISVQQIIINKRKIKEKEETIENALLMINEISFDLKDAKKNCSELARAVNLALKDKITVVKMCADAYTSLSKEPKVNPKDPYRYLDEDFGKTKEVIIQSFMTALNRFREDESLFSLLEDSVNIFRNDIMRRFRKTTMQINSEHPIFNESDYRIIMLLFAGVTDRTVAFLMNMSCSAVRTRKTRLKERIGRFLPEEGKEFLKALEETGLERSL